MNIRAKHGGHSPDGLKAYALLTYAMTEKNLTAEQKVYAQQKYEALEAAAMLRPDRGVGVAVEVGEKRPAAYRVWGAHSMATVEKEQMILAAANGYDPIAVRHKVISFSHAETAILTNEQVLEFGHRVACKLGFGQNPSMAAVHRDTIGKVTPEHPEGGVLHCHLTLGTVNPFTLKTVSDSFEDYELAKACREVELEMGLEHGHGAYIIDGDQRVVLAPPEQRRAWDLERAEKARRQSVARAVDLLEQGLETRQHRVDALEVDVAKAFDKAAECDGTVLIGDLLHLAEKHGFDFFRRGGTVVIRDLPGFKAGPAGSAETSVFGHDRLRGMKLTREAADEELLARTKRDPGWLMEDVVAGGKALVTKDDLHGRLNELTYRADIAEAIVEHAMTSPGVVNLAPPGDAFLGTTRRQQQLSEEIRDRVTRLCAERVHWSPAKLERAIRTVEQGQGFQLDPDQRAAALRSVQYRGTFIVGDAGTGKTTLMQVLAEYERLMGRESRGFAHGQKQADGLEAATGIPSQNLDRAFAREAFRGEAVVTPGGLAAVDEMGQVDLEHASELLDRIEGAKGRFVCIGDLAQTKSITAGSFLTIGLAAQQDEVKLSVVHRMRVGSAVEWQREAIPRGGEAIRTADRSAAQAYFQEYVDHGCVTSCATRREQVDAMAAEVVCLEREGAIALLPARTHRENLHHSEQIRRELGLEGCGHRFKLERGWREVSVGERLLLTKNANSQQKKAGLDVTNGDIVRVTHVSRNPLGKWTIGATREDGERITLDPSIYPHIEYGYAFTVARSQGATVKHSLPDISPAMNADEAHTALSRSTHYMHAYTTIPLDEFAEHLSAPERLLGKSEVTQHEEFVRQVGGEDSAYARAMARAERDANDPLRLEHLAYNERILERRKPVLERIDADYAARLAGAGGEAASAKEKRDLTRAYKRAVAQAIEEHVPLTFREWSRQNRSVVEHDQRKATKRADAVRQEQARRQAQSRAQTRTRAAEQKLERTRGMRH
ncbi:MAG: AAA family ATPase [Candidatus Velthaea sp.]